MINSLFLAHGSPMIALLDTPYTQFLKSLSKRLETPNAVIVFSAHWETEEIEITATDGPNELIYDFYGFPDQLYNVKYESNGSVELAKKIQQLFTKAKIPSQLQSKRGIDHGVWTILKHLYPKLKVPLIQISIQPFRSLEYQFKVGEALKSLKNESVLIIGSGGTVHNLRKLDFHNRDSVAKWAIQFDDWLIEKVKMNQVDDLLHYESLAPFASIAVPRNEHYIPLYIAMGVGEGGGRLMHQSYEYHTLSHLAFQF